MTWELVASLAVTLAALVSGLRVVLPFVLHRGEVAADVEQLKKELVELKHVVEVHQQALGMGVRGLPRMGVSR